MQAARKAATGIAQVSCQGVRTFNAGPSNSAANLKCIRGFKSTPSHPFKRFKSFGHQENSDAVICQNHLLELNSWSSGCNKNSRTMSSLQKSCFSNLDEETPSSSITRNSISLLSKDIFGSSCFLLSQGFVSPNHITSQFRNACISPIFSSGMQIRFISHHARRKNLRRVESRTLSTQKDESGTEKTEEEKDETQLTLYQRFKKTYKEHGKVLVAVHVATSIVWFGSFYAAVRCGIDIVPYLESWNFSDRLISPFRSGGVGDIALAYLMYKLATPARYTVTIGGTNLAIRYLRKEGKMQPVPEGDSLRELYKEGKADLKLRSQERMNNIKHKGIRRRRNRNQRKDDKED